MNIPKRFRHEFLDLTSVDQLNGDVNSLGHNLIRNPSGANLSGTLTGNILNQDPKLGPLAGNGGPTQTQALLTGSPAIDAADSAAPATDQRGVSRPQGPASDIGAFEWRSVRRGQ